MKGVSKTAYFCCGARMLDAESRNPICNDSYAYRFMDEDGWKIFDLYRQFSENMFVNTIRHRIIDDILAIELEKNQETSCIVLGAGFDTRAYRLNGGRWFEIDDPMLIQYKNDRLPLIDSRNLLKRIPYNFNHDSLETKLTELSVSAPVVIIIEGVFFYLDENQIIQMIKILQASYPEHLLVCDLQTLRFFKTFNTKFQKVLKSLGTELRTVSDLPQQLFLNHGYRIRENIPILDRIGYYAKLTIRHKIIKLALQTLLKGVKDGYTIYTFEYNCNCPHMER